MLLMVAGVTEVKFWILRDDGKVDPVLRGDESGFSDAGAVVLVVDAVVFPPLLMLFLLL